ncbi:MAG: alpha/beta fold hydrolase [Hyphomonas sp.]
MKAQGLDWTTEGADWPNRDVSRFVEAGGYRWHIQRAGQGESLLLLHGTGASTHSWAGLLPALARQFDVLAMDLPGHGFTVPVGRLDASLPGMVRSLNALLAAEQFHPACIVGHSAGAAIALKMAPQLGSPLRHVIALNGALKPFGGPAALIAPMMAKALAINPIAYHALAKGGRDPERVARLIEGTGSRPGPDYLRNYSRLFGAPRHVSGTLTMMANWDVSGVLPGFARAGLGLHQIVGLNDRAVAPEDAADIARRYKSFTLERLTGLGHLAHEEDAERVAASIFAVLQQAQARVRKSGT